MADRSTIFIDGSNWFHGLRKLGLDYRDLDYPRLAAKLLMRRRLVEIRYYIGQLTDDLRRIRRQQRVLAELRRQGIVVRLGRVERNAMAPENNPVARQLRDLLGAAAGTMAPELASELARLSAKSIPYYVEKQTDVRIAVDLVSMAYRDSYDVAYLLSADGDFVPAVAEARRIGKRVFAASPMRGHRLAGAADAFIHLPREWFRGLARR